MTESDFRSRPPPPPPPRAPTSSRPPPTPPPRAPLSSRPVPPPAPQAAAHVAAPPAQRTAPQGATLAARLRASQAARSTAAPSASPPASPAAPPPAAYAAPPPASYSAPPPASHVALPPAPDSAPPPASHVAPPPASYSAPPPASYSPPPASYSAPPPASYSAPPAAHAAPPSALHAAPPGPSLLKVRNLRASYGQGHVLHGVDVDVALGGVTAVLGANGAGKTTFLRAVCGLVKREGEIHFAGERIDQLTTEDIARAGIAHVPDGRGTFGSLTVEENLRLGGYVRRDKAAVQRDMARMYEYFPRLQERREQQAGTLSGGEQQMLAISRALMLAPKLLVLDEPSFGLAPLITQEIFRIMRAINAEQRLSVLIVEQNATLALAFADHACVLETGRVVATGTPEFLRDDETIRRAYLGY